MNAIKKLLVLAILFAGAHTLHAQIDANSLFGLPSGTTAEMNSIASPNVGSLLYNTDDDHLYRYTSSGWKVISLSTLANNGDGTLTFTNQDGTAVNIVLSDITVNGDGTYTFTNGDGTDVILDTRASSNPYDNGASGLTSNTVQAAIDELATASAANTDTDPTNELSDLDLTGNQLTLTNAAAGATGVDLSAYLDNTDEQDLELSGNTLSLTGDGTSVDLSLFLDNTDDQDASEVAVADAANNFTASDVEGVLAELAASNAADGDTDSTNELSDLDLTGNQLTLTNAAAGATGVDLSAYLDNTDEQDLELSGNTLSLTGDGTAVDLSLFLDNTDEQDLELSGNTLSLTGDATAVDLSPFLDNTDEQDLELSGNTLSLTGDATAVDLSAYLDNTDDQDASEVAVADAANNFTASDVEGVLAELAASNAADGDTDSTNELSDLDLTGNQLTLTNAAAGATGVDLSAYLDNTDEQDLELSGNTLSLTGDGTAVDLSLFLDNTDEQDLELSGNTLSLTGDATAVDLSAYLDNTDDQDASEVAVADAANNFTASDVEGVLAELAASNAADGDTDSTNELSDLDLTGNQLTLTNAAAGATGVDLSAYLDNTDEQDLELSGNTLSLTGDGTAVDLSLFLDNTDEQDLELSGNTLSLTGDATAVDLSAYLDNTDDQDASEVAVADAANNFTASDVEGVLAELAASNAADGDTDSTNELSDLDLTGNQLTLTNAAAGATGVDLSAYLDNTDEQDLELSGNTLSLTGDGTSVDLSAFLDNTDDQTIDALSMDSGNLNISLEDDGEANQTVNLISSQADNQLVAGSDGALYVNVTSTMPTIYATGKVNANGTAASIYGATVSRLNEGDYQVTFSSALSDTNYIIQLTVLDCGGDCPGNGGSDYDDPGITYYDQANSGFKVNIGDSDNGATQKDDIDIEFMFTIIVLP